MPPPVPSESESELYYDSSDAESVHTIDNEPSGHPSTARQEAQEPTDSSSSEADSDAGGAAAAKPRGGSFIDVALPAPKPRAKRKADFASANDGYAVKFRRREPTDGESAESEDGIDSPVPGGYVEQSFSAGDDPVPGGADPAPLSLHPSYPKTALTLFKETYPHLTRQLVKKPGKLFKYLAQLPVRRIPVVTQSFNDSKPQNVVAYLMQAAGDVVPIAESCGKCYRQSGVFKDACVVIRSPEVAEVTGGACAVCWYGRQGSLCTFRQDTPTGEAPLAALPGAAPQRPAPVLENRLEPLMASAPGPTASAPLHPSYVAALAAGTTSAAPTPTVAPNPSPGPPHDPFSPSKEVRVWEERYSSMSTENLLWAHEDLVRWKEDLTTRLIAMNRVVLQRLMEREGSSRGLGGARTWSEETEADN
ncbi:uncharacterized protein P884DRAFT_302940 [Thermothelomyces heterothallicus CBS 202.75]|uniref:uncharacterized protein n=1 Tax=Thermothelomyces heterothallicus CBS 202.75 TaxID=1149848 RepID=UPI0037436E78